MNKYWKELRPVLIAGAGAFILALILPARVTVTCRELISYTVLSLFKNWIVTVMAVVFALLVSIALGRFPKQHRKKSKRKIGVRIGIVSAITLTATFGFSLYCDLLRSPQNLPAVGFAGCFTVGADGVLVEDSDAEYIAESLFLAGQKAASGHSSFNLGLINLYKVQTPSFLPPLLGQKNLDRLMQSRGQIKQYTSLIYCYRKPNMQQLEFRTVFFSEAWRADNMPFDNRLEDDLSSISGDPSFDTGFFLNFASSYYVAVIGQSVEDYLISIKEYQKAHFALDDSETIFRRTFGDFLHMGTPATVARATRLENYWYSDIARLRASIFLSQEDYPSAARQMLLALDYDEYFPCKNYEDFKLTWMRAYAASLNITMNNTNAVDPTNGDYPDINAGWPYEPVEATIKSLAIEQGTNSTVCDILENGFSKLLEKRKDDPLIWLCWGEAVKFLAKGNARDNYVYLDRIPESRAAYEHARSLDSNFPLIPIKLGALELFGKNHNDKSAFPNEKARELINQGSEVFTKYLNAETNTGVDAIDTNTMTIKPSVTN